MNTKYRAGEEQALAEKRKRLVVIDGKSVFYRGYYAMPNLATKDGTPTGGVYGFAVMALEVLKKMNPDYVAVAWDKPKTNIRRRTDIYPEYKANRKPAPPDFYEQVPVLHELLDAFGWPLYEVDDHEADDIMGTFAAQANEKDVDTVLITSDHDVFQLVNGHTKVAKMKKGLTNVEMFDEEHFRKVYDMTPQQFIDFKSLRGDPSDNIPGVAGVGEKTAKKLIDDYGSIKNIYEHIDEIQGSLKDKLLKDRDHVDIAKQLVTLDIDVPLTLDWEKADVSDADPAAIADILRRLEFRSLLKQLPEDMKQDPAVVEGGGFAAKAAITHITHKKDLKKIAIGSSKELVLHTHTAGPVNTELQTVLISPNEKTVYAVDTTGEVKPDDLAKYIHEQLHDEEVGLIGYDIKSALKAFLQLKIPINGVKHDVRMAAFLINSLIREQALTKLAQDELGYEGADIDAMSPLEQLQAADTITSVIWGLYEAQKSKLKKLPKLAKLAEEIEWPVIEVLARMEVEGIKLDIDYMQKMSKQLEDQISDVEQEIYGLANKEFNISSPAQLSTVLFDDLNLPKQFIKKTKTGYSTAASELDKLRDKHDIIDKITEYREFTKLKSTYVDTLPEMVDENSRLHTTFSLAVAPTGRLSSHDPNLQNIPIRTELGRKIREAFIPRDGYKLISADYSQFELRLAAVLAGDDELIEAFNDGLDIHTRTASQVYGVALEDVTKEQRRDAKVINFGILYGMSPHGLSVATGMSQKEATEFIKRYFELRKPILDFIEDTKDKAKHEGYVETMFGRRRPTPDVNSSNFVVRESALRAAVNMPIQGTEADLMKMAMIEVDKHLDDDVYQLLQIHDSILLEAPAEKAEKVGKLVKTLMENVYKLPVNLDVDVDVGDNWGTI